MKERAPAAFFFVPPSSEQASEDWRAALQHEPMRRIFRRLLAVGNVMGPSFAADDKSTAFNEGVRTVGLWVAAQIEQAVPGQVAALMRESCEDQVSYRAMQNEE